MKCVKFETIKRKTIHINELIIKKYSDYINHFINILPKISIFFCLYWKRGENYIFYYSYDGGIYSHLFDLALFL